jgi:hypothetical protein
VDWGKPNRQEGTSIEIEATIAEPTIITVSIVPARTGSSNKYKSRSLGTAVIYLSLKWFLNV